MSGFSIHVDTSDNAAFLESRVYDDRSGDAALIKTKNAIRGILAGTFQSGIAAINIGSATATATVTIGAGDFVAADTITINGVVFTARASGAVANEFNIGGSTTITATNLVNSILASTNKLIIQTIRPSSVANVVTLTSRIPGVIGNAAATGGLFTLAKSATNVTLTTTFVGGTDSSTQNFII